MRRKLLTLCALLCGALLAVGSSDSHAEPTRLVVRVLAHDAKLIGDAAGGAQVLVRERDTGRILVEGMQLGGTGSTEQIVVQPRVRGASIYDTEGAASFRCELDLETPTWVTIEAAAPMAYPQSRAHASTTMLVLPGRDVEGDGVVLELNGLIVNLLAPHPEAKLHGGQTLEVSAGVKLLCTCPIFEGSLWESGDYLVLAELWVKGERLRSVELKISDAHNVFAGAMELPEVGPDESLTAELRITAGNDAEHNFGWDRAIFKIAE